MFPALTDTPKGVRSCVVRPAARRSALSRHCRRSPLMRFPPSPVVALVVLSLPAACRGSVTVHPCPSSPRAC